MSRGAHCGHTQEFGQKVSPRRTRAVAEPVLSVNRARVLAY